MIFLISEAGFQELSTPVAQLMIQLLLESPWEKAYEKSTWAGQ